MDTLIGGRSLLGAHRVLIPLAPELSVDRSPDAIRRSMPLSCDPRHQISRIQRCGCPQRPWKGFPSKRQRQAFRTRVQVRTSTRQPTTRIGRENPCYRHDPKKIALRFHRPASDAGSPRLRWCRVSTRWGTGHDQSTPKCATLGTQSARCPSGCRSSTPSSGWLVEHSGPLGRWPTTVDSQERSPEPTSPSRPRSGPH